MLEALKKKLQGDAPTVALADHEALQAEFDGYKATAEELLAAAEAANEELKTKLAALQEFASAAEAAAEAAEKQAIEMKAAARKEKIVAAVGTEKADALFAATESLEDGKFEAIVSAMAASADAEANSKMFKEQGADLEVDKTAVQAEESSIMKSLKAKYTKAK